MPLVALTRAVPDSLGACELTHLERVPIDVARARAQHAAYERLLEAAGCTVRRLPALHDAPDSVFVEDTAVVFDEIAVITRPGAPSRRGETDGVAGALSGYRRVERLSAPATLDGGDVLRLGRTLLVGVGGRTNDAGVTQLAGFVGPWGYEVRAVAAGGCLHLKSAATEPAPGLVLLNPAWVDRQLFAGRRTIDVDPLEPFAANVLSLGGTVLCAAAGERTSARLAAAGLAVQAVDVSELAKAEAGMTCCSLIVQVV
jgi:dimethylargininase